MRRFFLSLLVLCWTLPASAELFQLDSFTLDNGLQVIIIPNHRAPVVMQIVYYRTGQADEAPGKSGLAHFLEHLIFKGTSNAAPGEFSAMVARMGGEENAFTTRDTTAYWQMVDRDRLEVILRYEADRMQNLLLKDDEVLPERDVILEERRQRIDNDARQRLNERVQSALFVNHPYRIPTIGWMHEMAALTPDDARAWYQRWYAPNNAILLLGGDITLEEARPLIEKYYGVIPRKDLPLRWRPLEPLAWAARRVELSDATVQQEQLSQVFRLPHRSELQVGDAEALDVLAEIMGGGGSSRLYRSLAIEQALASRAGAFAQVDMIDYGSFSLYAIPRDGVTLDALEAALNAERQRLLAEGVSATEVADAIRRLTDSAVFARDDPTTAPRLIGSLLAAGWTLEEIQSWPERVAAVTPERVNELARLVLIPENSVTGLLRKGQP